MKEQTGPTGKKKYHKPEFSLYGDIHQLTQASSLTGMKQDGVKSKEGNKWILYKTG